MQVAIAISITAGGGGSDYQVAQAVISDSSWMTESTSLTDEQTVARRGMGADRPELPALTPDTEDRGQNPTVPFYFSSGAMTNLVSPQIDLAPDIGTGGTVTDLGSGVYRLNLPDVSGSYVRFTASIPSGRYAVAFEMRNHPGSVENGVLVAETWDWAGAFEDKVGYRRGCNPSSDWRDYIGVGDEDGTADSLVLKDQGGCDVEVRNLRFYNHGSWFPPSAWTAGINTTYDINRAESSVAPSVVGTIYGVVVPCGWRGDENPVNLAPRIFAGFGVELTYTGTLWSAAGITVAHTPRNRRPFFFAFTWDGATDTLYVDGTKASAASTSRPIAPVDMLNHKTADRPFHGGGALAYINRVITDDETRALESLLLSTASGILDLAFPAALPMWGDSMTNLIVYDNVQPTFEANLGRPWVNFGVGGESSTEIAGRFADEIEFRDPQHTPVFWVGHNNPEQPETIKADIANMVATVDGEYAVMAVALTSGVDTLNADLASIYGDRFVDVVAGLQEATGEEDWASFREDDKHLNQSGNEWLVDWLPAQLKAKNII